MTTHYSRHPDLRLTELEGEGIVLHLGSRKYFSVSETGLLVLNALDSGPSTEGKLLGKLLEEYDVSPEIAEKNLREFLGRCLDARLLSKVSGA